MYYLRVVIVVVERKRIFSIGNKGVCLAPFTKKLLAREKIDSGKWKASSLCFVAKFTNFIGVIYLTVFRLAKYLQTLNM